MVGNRRVLMGNIESGHCVQAPARYLLGPLLPRADKNTCKLVPAVPGDQIARSPRGPAQSLCHPSQTFVARQVSVPVVELFKIVDVHEEKRELRTIAHASAP